MALPDHAQQPQAHAGPLAQIPVEILVRITSFLPTRDLANVRLTCRSLEQSLFHFFSHEFFRKKQFMVFSESLQALIDISKHPALSRELKHVIIATDGLREETLAYLETDPTPAPSAWMDFAQFAQVRLAQADQHHLLHSGGLKDMLAEAFRNLPNLDTVDIRDFNSSTRNRDGEGAGWTSYGSKTLARRIDYGPVPNKLSLSFCRARARFPDQIFSAVLAALASADAHPSQIQVNLRSRSVANSWRETWDLSENAFYIPPRLEASLEPILAGLTVLHLDLSAHDPVYQRGTQTPRPFLLHRFLSLTPNLAWLRLNMSAKPPLPRGSPLPFDSVFKWISSEFTPEDTHPSVPYPTQLIRFSKLERLDIGGAIITERTFLRLVRKLAPVLKTLSLRRVGLLKRPTDANSDKATGWAHLFEQMGALDRIDIRELNLAYLGEDMSFARHARPGKRVGFMAGGSAEQTADRSFRGTSTAAIVAQILKDIVTVPAPIGFGYIAPEDSSGNEESPSSEEEEEEEEEEEDQDDDDDEMDVD